MLLGIQILMARAALRWSVADLASAAGISEKTIWRLEKSDGLPPNTTTDTLLRLRNCFEEHGITFLIDDGSAEGPGIRVSQYEGRRIRNTQE